MVVNPPSQDLCSLGELVVSAVRTTSTSTSLDTNTSTMAACLREAAAFLATYSEVFGGMVGCQARLAALCSLGTSPSLGPLAATAVLLAYAI